MIKNMRRKYLFIVLVLIFSISFTGCNSGKVKDNQNSSTGNNTQTSTIDKSANQSGSSQNNNSVDDSQSTPQIDVSKVKPNESGKIMIVMFHNFIESYKKGDKLFTTTFDEFGKLLQTLYDSDYRLINLNDFLNNNIDVPAGCIPMVFTFDDGTAGEFNLVNENGSLVANKKSAVGIMEEFNKIHPDFGLKGTFYINLGIQTFRGEGTLAERLKYLVDKGFELGNHTYSHIHLNKAKSAEEIQKEIGGNQKKMYELIPGYEFKTFSLPYGQPSMDLRQYVEKGEYEGIKYQNIAIMNVGAEPSVSPLNPKFNPLSTKRVRSQGIVPVDTDLTWWLNKLTRQEQYVSDGNPNSITIPKDREEKIDKSKLNGKKIIVY